MTEYRSDENVNQPGYFLQWGRGGGGGNRVIPPTDQPPTIDPKPQKKPYLEAAKGIWGKPIPLFIGAVRLTTQPLWFGGMVEDDFGVFADFALVMGSPLDPDHLPVLHQIWADDTLIYDVDTGTRYEGTWTFEFHNGSETQAVDALIADGVGDPDDTPAFLGLSYITFADFPISPFKNRIPFIGLVTRSHGLSRVPVSDVIEAFARRMGFADGDVTVTGITDECDGHISIEGSNFRSFLDEIEPLRFDILDGNGTVEIVRRPLGDGLTIDRALVQADLVSSGADDPTFDATLSEETSIPNEIDIAYPDKLLDYQQGHQTKRRPVYPIPATASRVKREISTPFIITPSEALSIAASELMRGWGDKGSASLTLSHENLDIEPGDTLSVVTDIGDFNMHVRGARITSTFQNQVSVSLLRIAPDVSLDAESGDPLRLGPATICIRLTQIDLEYPIVTSQGYRGSRVLSDVNYLYFLRSGAGGHGDHVITRVNRTDHSDIDTLNINSAYAAFTSLIDGTGANTPAVIHEGFLYWVGDATTGASPRVVRVDLSDFTSVSLAVLTQVTTPGRAWKAHECFVASDYLYIGARGSGSFSAVAHADSPPLSRLNLADFATWEMINFGPASGVLIDTNDLFGAVTDGEFGYFASTDNVNLILILDLATFTLAGITTYDYMDGTGVYYLNNTFPIWIDESHLYIIGYDQYDRPFISRMRLTSREPDSGIAMITVDPRFDGDDVVIYKGISSDDAHYLLAIEDSSPIAGVDTFVIRLGKNLSAGSRVEFAVCGEDLNGSFRDMTVVGSGLYFCPFWKDVAVRVPKYAIPWFRT